MLVLGLEPGGFHLSGNDFRRRVRERWPDADVQHQPQHDTADLTAHLAPPGGRSWSIDHARDGELLSTDGDRRQVDEFVAWVCSWLTPDQAAFLMDDGAHAVVRLRPGMTATEARAEMGPPPWA